MKRAILAAASAAIIYCIAISLFYPAQAGAGRLRPASSNKEPGRLLPSPDDRQNLPDASAVAFKGQGRLALVWRGLLYVIDGDTGEVGQLTDSGQASQPAWSYDGEWLAFVRADGMQATPAAPAGEGTLWLVRRDGTRIHQVQAPGPVARASWSPTANVLAAGGQNGIWLAPVEGGPRQLSDSAASTPVWSPDGKSLAYTVTLPFDSDHPEDRSDALYTIAVDRSQPSPDGTWGTRRLVAPQTGIRLVGWWPDGRGLLYWVDPMHSASLAADGMGLYSLRLGEAKPAILGTGLAHQGWVSLSPQGSLLMVAGGGRMVWADKSLAVIDAESGKARKLKNPEGQVANDPALSTDGSRIAFVAARDLGRSSGFDNPEELAAWVATRSLWVEDADGSGARLLSTAGQGVYQPFWSKDGSHILYVRENSLWLIDAGGGVPKRICGPSDREDDGADFGYYGHISYLDKYAWFQP
jgi:Tol biopolymer transport system component